MGAPGFAGLILQLHAKFTVDTQSGAGWEIKRAQHWLDLIEKAEFEEGEERYAESIQQVWQKWQVWQV